MSDPARWRESRAGAPEGVRDLLTQAARTKAISSAQRARVVARASALATGKAAGFGLGLMGKVLVVAAVVTAAGAPLVAWVVSSARRPAPPHAATAPRAPGRAATAASPPRPGTIAPIAAPAPTAPSVAVRAHLRVAPPAAIPQPLLAHAAPATLAPAAVATATAPGPTPTSPPPEPTSAATAASVLTSAATPPASGEPEGDPLEREVQSLDRVRAVVDGDPEQALSLLAAHEAAFPQGQMVRDREFLAIKALHRLGRDAAMRARAAAFLARFPQGVYADRVRRIVSGD